MNKLQLLFILIIVNLGLFSEHLDKLNIALSKLEYDKDLFSYELETEQINKNKKDISKVIFNPDSDPQYKLVLKNGSIPTESEIKEFYKNSNNSGRNSEFEDILGERYNFVTIEDGLELYEFITKRDVIPKKKSRMNGKLWLNPDSETISRILIYNSDKIDITLGVELNVFTLEFTFNEYSREISVIDNMNMHFSGKAVFLEFDQESRSKIYNYTMLD